MYTDKKNILQLVALLEAHGITKVVLCPGSRNTPIVHTLSNHPNFTCYPVTDELLATFAGHKSMVNLGVEDGALTDACFPVFFAMPKLRYLLLDGNAASTAAACPPCKAASWTF